MNVSVAARQRATTIRGTWSRTAGAVKWSGVTAEAHPAPRVDAWGLAWDRFRDDRGLGLLKMGLLTLVLLVMAWLEVVP